MHFNTFIALFLFAKYLIYIELILLINIKSQAKKNLGFIK